MSSQLGVSTSQMAPNRLEATNPLLDESEDAFADPDMIRGHDTQSLEMTLSTLVRKCEQPPVLSSFASLPRPTVVSQLVSCQSGHRLMIDRSTGEP